jgi:hypothetical protein
VTPACTMGGFTAVIAVTGRVIGSGALARRPGA